MAARSFRKDLELAPTDYRTPSPPLGDFEPISPGSAEWSQIWSQPLQRFAPGNTQNEVFNIAGSTQRASYGSNGVLNSAIDVRVPETGSANKYQQTRQTSSARNHHPAAAKQRPNKRARSEKAASAAWHDGTGAQSGGHAEESDTRRLEAELLLNFSREACNKARSYSMNSVTTHRPDGLVQQLLVEQSPLASSGQVLHYDTYVDTFSPDTVSDHKVPRKELQNSADTALTEDALHHKQNSSDKSDGIITREHQIVNVSQGPTSSSCTAKGKHVERNVGLEEGAVQVSDLQKQVKTASTEQVGPQDVTEDSGASASKILDSLEEAAKAGSYEPAESNNSADTAVQAVKSSGAKQKQSETVCAACNFTRNVLTADTENDATSWICCDGCKSWFHFACAGFKNEREVRSVDKFRCRKCKPIHGPTTYVRKSARAHSAIDYAGLNEGIVKSSDENPEHHYIKPIKEGTIKFDQENFARMRPEFVTADYFEKGDGMKEPILIPAMFNPRPRHIHSAGCEGNDGNEEESSGTDELHDVSVLNEWLSEGFEYEQIQDCGQDSLDMVIPLDLTVRKVSELYGPEEKIEVIDVKSQNGEDKKWNMRRWVDYYEAQGSKPVRNVISLEVSQSKLGRLIRRPKVVRDLDLQDAVWPPELIAKGDFPKVQFYCLMSVADCFTDFHIDFGGSSVYYHILKGKKTFFFIPPHEKHLKKYEEWCNSPAQNWTFLGDQTKECYRVDLSEGDTMLIPAGWIHAVWTPEDSLVIGGNFLTRMHYAMQIRVTQIEKATHVARKFRYPYFQKIQWYAAIRYLEEDPLPASVQEILGQGQEFQRDIPTYMAFDAPDEETLPVTDAYHFRYYSKAELDGLPELTRLLHRTALIASGHITDGISAETRNAVKRSIPKGFGEPFEMAQRFAMWVAWKRGNENIPHWAYPGYVPESTGTDVGEKKLSAKAMKKLDREAALQAWRVAPDRQSTRPRNQPQNLLTEMMNGQSPSNNSTKTSTPTPSSDPNVSMKRKAESLPKSASVDGNSPTAKKPRLSVGNKPPTTRRPACEACRKGRRACKHRDDPPVQPNGSQSIDTQASVELGAASVNASLGLAAISNGSNTINGSTDVLMTNHSPYSDLPQSSPQAGQYIPDTHVTKIGAPIQNGDVYATPPKASGRSKACKDCRKSKRRCVHDEFGNEDPAKLEQAVIPRPAAKKKRPSGEGAEPSITKKPKKASLDAQTAPVDVNSTVPTENSGPIGSDDNAEPEQPQLESVIDPRLEAMSMEFAQSQEGDVALQSSSNHINGQDSQSNTLQSVFNPDDEVNLIATSPISDLKTENQVEQEEIPSGSNLSHQVATSLVSPPESTHTDAEQTPPATGKSRGLTPPATSSSSRHSSRPAKTAQRYTPESGSVRRASVSSVGQVNGRESVSPVIGTGQTSATKRPKSRGNSQNEADEESLKLIRELQAQDMGLRRRGRGS